MAPTHPAAPRATAFDPAVCAKAALRRLASHRLEPTPENYARAFREEAGQAFAAAAIPERARQLIERLAARAFDAGAGAGAGSGAGAGAGAASSARAASDFAEALAQGRWDDAERVVDDAIAIAADGTAIAVLIGRIARGLGRTDRGWTTARKQESVQRVLEGSRSDAARLRQRLSQLVSSWEGAKAGADSNPDLDASPAVPPAAPSVAPALPPAATPLPWGRALGAMGGALELALPLHDDAPHALALALAELTRRVQLEGADAALIDEIETVCRHATPLLQHRHHLHEQLAGLCAELTASLTDLAENDSWAKGQCEAMQLKIDEGLSARGIRAVSELLRDTRARQGQLREEREQARDSLKLLINRMLAELTELGAQTGGFHESVGRHAVVIERADTLESLAGAVREMVEESRSVESLVQQTRTRLHDQHAKASGLARRVSELEAEMQRLSGEVSTDQLTQIANRRGLLQVFEVERGRAGRDGSTMSIGLLDIDNFKRLNDDLGHVAGDAALKALAALIRETLRPGDTVARYGGEEFVVLLPDTRADEGRKILARLQRALTGGLFLHEQRQVLVTFSAGVTVYSPGEPIEAALERADQALYQAKRTGKNRTCIA